MAASATTAPARSSGQPGQLAKVFDVNTTRVLPQMGAGQPTGTER